MTVWGQMRVKSFEERVLLSYSHKVATAAVGSGRLVLEVEIPVFVVYILPGKRR